MAGHKTADLGTFFKDFGNTVPPVRQQQQATDLHPHPCGRSYNTGRSTAIASDFFQWGRHPSFAGQEWSVLQDHLEQ
jgi:hypothetical protein